MPIFTLLVPILVSVKPKGDAVSQALEYIDCPGINPPVEDISVEVGLGHVDAEVGETVSVVGVELTVIVMTLSLRQPPGISAVKV